MSLQLLGLSPDQEAVYRGLLGAPESASSALAERIGLSVAEVAVALDVLTAMGLVTHRENRYATTPPDVAIEGLIEQHERRIEQEKAQLELSRDVVGELVQEFLAANTGADAGDAVELIADAHVVRSRLYELSMSAQRRTCTMVPGGAIPPAAVESSLRIDRALLARGISVRTVVSETAAADATVCGYLEQIEEAGAQVRIHPNPPCVMVLVDESAVVAMGNGRGGAYVIPGSSIVAAMDSLFEMVWNEGAPRSVSGDFPGGFGEARSRQIVALLAKGYKDEAIARRLGVSTRTVRRMVADAVALLGAESRFQAGVLAAQKGWLGPAPTKD